MEFLSYKSDSDIFVNRLIEGIPRCVYLRTAFEENLFNNPMFYDIDYCYNCTPFCYSFTSLNEFQNSFRYYLIHLSLKFLISELVAFQLNV